MRQIDRPTIEALQGRAPGACKTDHDDLLAKFRSGQIFGDFPEQQRETFWPKVCSASQRCLIPSLFTFFEDRKFLACAAECMRRIVDVGPRDTIAGRLEDTFTDANQQSDRCVVQLSETTFGSITGDVASRLDLGMRQLWLAAFRMYRDLPADPQKKDLLAKARTKADETALFELASLASRLGFESEKIKKILRASPDRSIAERALLAARKPGRFIYDNQQQRIQQVVDIFATASPMSVAEASDHSQIIMRGQPPKRHGVPHDVDHDCDEAWIFLPKLDNGLEADQTSVSSLFIRRSVYLAYFGQPPSTESCIPNNEAPRHDVFMTGHTSTPPGPGLDRVELNAAMIRRELDPEQDIQQDFSYQVNEQCTRLQQLTRETENEQEKLDRLRALAAAEQDRLDGKQTKLNLLAAEEEQHNAKLRQLAERQQEEQEKLDQLMQRVREEEERQRSEMTLVLHGDPMAEAEQPPAGDEELRDEPQGEPMATRRDNRLTRFAFERLLPESSEEATEGEGGALTDEPKVRIEFKVVETDGRLKISDTLDVNLSDPSLVQRVAAKYVRKGFWLFDMYGHNLTAKNCFKQVTWNGTNTIVVKDVSPAGSTSRKKRIVSIEEETRAKKNRGR